MQTVCFWSQSHLDPPLTSSKEGPGVQDFFKKRRNRESAYGWSDAIAHACQKIVLRVITKEASVFFDCAFYRDHWPDMTPLIDLDIILFWTAQNCCINADDFVKLHRCDALFGRKICQQS
jgi:hypothetical protein